MELFGTRWKAETRMLKTVALKEEIELFMEEIILFMEEIIELVGEIGLLRLKKNITTTHPAPTTHKRGPMVKRHQLKINCTSSTFRF